MSDDTETSPTAQEPTAASRPRLPDWAPLVVLGALVFFAALGGLGLIPLKLPAGARPPPASSLPTEPADQGNANGPKFTLKSRDAGAGPATAPAQPSSAAPGGKATIVVNHLVVTHKESPLGAAKKIVRTKEEAQKRAEEALARAKKGEDFLKIVVEYSDEHNAAERKGRFSGFTQKDAIQPFGDVAYSLKPGQLSGVVETKLGFHVIRRAE